jgi:hypothetical protein
MKLIGKIAIAIVILLAITYGISYAGTQGWLEKTPLKNWDYGQLNVFEKGTIDQTKVLTERAKETGEHVQQILGDTVQVDEQGKEKPLHEKTIEYARYLYCKQVVNDWEKTE